MAALNSCWTARPTRAGEKAMPYGKGRILANAGAIKSESLSADINRRQQSIEYVLVRQQSPRAALTGRFGHDELRDDCIDDHGRTVAFQDLLGLHP